MPLMSMEEKVKIIRNSLAVKTHEEEMALLMELPLDPGMAKVARAVLGVEGSLLLAGEYTDFEAIYGRTSRSIR